MGAELAAVVLCGGHSRRMGRPKAWLPFGEETLLARTLRRLAPAAEHLIVVAAAAQALPPWDAALGDRVTVGRDPVPAEGPLRGLAVGLALAERWARRAFVCATDVPFVSHEYVRALDALAQGYELTLVEDAGHLHPLAAIYETSLHREASALLEAGTFRTLELVRRCRTRVVTRELLLRDAALRRVDPELHALDNLNTEADYDAALARARAQSLPT